MKRVVVIAVVLFIIILTGTHSAAYDIPDVDELIDDEIRDTLPAEMIESVKSGGTLAGDVILWLFDVFKSLIKPVVGRLFSILAIIIVCGCFRSGADALESESARNLCALVSSAALATVCAGILVDMWKSMSVLVERLVTLNNGMTASVILVYSISGSPTAAAVTQANVTVAVDIISNLYGQAALPVLQLCFGLYFTEAVSREIRIGGLADLIRKAYTVLIGVLMGILTTILSLQSALSTSADSMLVRGVKLAAGSFIPIVGNAVGEASRTVAAGLSSLKATLGGICVLCIIATVAPLLITMTLNKVAFLVGLAFGEVLGLDSEAKFLRDSSCLINFSIALVASVALVFVINLMIFAKSAVVVGG